MTNTRAVVSLAAVLLLNGCVQSRVLSPYASMTMPNRSQQGALQTRPAPHRGIDVRAYSQHDPVIAAADGIVVATGPWHEGGYVVTLDHGDHEVVTRYARLGIVEVRPGDFVARGNALGRVGRLQREREVVHVHFEVCSNLGCEGEGALGGTVDPSTYLAGCFSQTRSFPTPYRGGRLVLTYPVSCDGGDARPPLWPRELSAGRTPVCPLESTWVDARGILGIAGCVNFARGRFHGPVEFRNDAGAGSRGYMDDGRRVGRWVSWDGEGTAEIVRFDGRRVVEHQAVWDQPPRGADD